MSELIITEKPSAARRISNALADGKVEAHKDGKVTFFELKNNNKNLFVASAAGHLYGLTKKTKNKTDYPIFDIEWQPTYKTSKNAAFTKKYLTVMTKLAKRSTTFTLACDYDIEGEVIGYNCLRFACKQKDASRMKFSTLTTTELREAYKNKSKKIDWGQAFAGETRHFIDWFYGINISMALMNSVKKAGSFKVLSSGRVQSPALKIVVDKELEIKKFKPEPYWQLKLLTKQPKLEANHKTKKFKNKKEAELAKNNTKNPLVVTKIKTTKKTTLALWPFDLGTLQSEAHANFYYTPKQTLALAQKLYLAGVISYPRTSSQKLPAKIGYKKILTKLSKNYPVAIDLIGKTPRQGKKEDSAHPAIFPTGNEPKQLEDGERKVYDLIVKRFLTTFGEPAEREHSTITLTSNEEDFLANGTKTIKQGWFKLYEPYIKLNEVDLPIIKEGQKLDIEKVVLDAKETKPPKRYTQASLVTELEKRGLGTKSTRAEIVDTLISRGYVESKPLTATDLGINIEAVLEKYVTEIVDDKFTKKIEEEMQEIRENKVTKDQVLEHAKKDLTKILKKFKSKELEIGKELLEAYRETIKKESEIGSCECGSILKIKFSRKNKSRFIGCEKYPDCTITLSIPQKGKITPTGKTCEHCKNPVIKIGRRQVCINKECPGKEFVDKVIEKPCPKCKTGTLKLRKSVYGEFLGCSNYPKCKTIEKL